MLSSDVAGQAMNSALRHCDTQVAQFRSWGTNVGGSGFERAPGKSNALDDARGASAALGPGKRTLVEGVAPQPTMMHPADADAPVQRKVDAGFGNIVDVARDGRHGVIQRQAVEGMPEKRTLFEQAYGNSVSPSAAVNSASPSAAVPSEPVPRAGAGGGAAVPVVEADTTPNAADKPGVESSGGEGDAGTRAEWLLEDDIDGGGAPATGGDEAGGKRIQRSAVAGSKSGDSSAIDAAVAAIPQSGGEAPDPRVLHKVQAATGADLSAARVHTGKASQRAADAVNAEAFAVDQQVHFAESKYQPRTTSGDHLLAHELVHTAQQARAGGGVLQARMAVSSPGEPAEVEAETIASSVASHSDVAASQPVRERGEGIQRNPAASIASTVTKRALVWLAKRGANVSAHIVKRHIARRLGKSTFTNGGKMVKKWITETLTSPGNIVDQGRRLVFEKSFGRAIGRGGEQIVRVVVDKATGKIVTAFPTQAFKTTVAVAVAAAASTKASEADAAIASRREAVAKALEPGWLETIVDFIVGTSSVARDEDIFAEERIIEAKINEAIRTAEEEMQRSLSQDERDEIREQIWLELQNEPTAGGGE